MVSRGMDNSRLKDYFDIWALSGSFQYDLELLITAMARTFKRNGLEMPVEWPVGLTDKFSENPMKISQWRAFLRKTMPLAKPQSLTEAIARIKLFLEPVVFGYGPTATWSPEDVCWIQRDR